MTWRRRSSRSPGRNCSTRGLTREQFVKRLLKPLNSLGAVIEVLEKRRVFCIASKEDEGDLLSYFYCLERHSKQTILSELKVTGGTDLLLVVKCRDDSLSCDFISLFKQVLEEEKLGV